MISFASRLRVDMGGTMSVACNGKAAIVGALFAVVVFAINFQLTGRPDLFTAVGMGIVAGLACRVWTCFLGPEQPPVQGD